MCVVWICTGGRKEGILTLRSRIRECTAWLPCVEEERQAVGPE